MNENQTTHQALLPHKYPILIKIIGIVVIGLFLYSLYLVPQYFTASKNLKNGENFLNQQNYRQAIISLEKVVEKVPSSKEAKILLAIAYFSNSDTEDDQNGIYHLQDITLYESDWNKVSAVMPEEYQELFNTING